MMCDAIDAVARAVPHGDPLRDVGGWPSPSVAVGGSLAGSAVRRCAHSAQNDACTHGRQHNLLLAARVQQRLTENRAAVSAPSRDWLRESHAIYAGRLPTEASQFRGFLLTSLGSFVPNDDLYGYVKAGLRFGDHAFDVASAAVAARKFADRAAELLPLM